MHGNLLVGQLSTEEKRNVIPKMKREVRTGEGQRFELRICATRRATADVLHIHERRYDWSVSVRHHELP
jgi:hypothetical protein